MTDSISEELYQGGVIPDGDRTMNTAALKHELQHSMTTVKDDLMKQFEEYFIGMEGDEDNSDRDDDQNTKELQVPTSLKNYLADGSGVSPKTKQSAFAELAANSLLPRKRGHQSMINWPLLSTTLLKENYQSRKWKSSLTNIPDFKIVKLWSHPKLRKLFDISSNKVPKPQTVQCKNVRKYLFHLYVPLSRPVRNPQGTFEPH